MSDRQELVVVPAPDEAVAAAFAAILADLNSPESVRAYRQEWRRFVDVLTARGINPLAARTFDVQTYLLGLRAAGKKASTRARALAVIRTVYAALARQDVLKGANPAREAKNPKGDTGAARTPWLTEEQLKRFLAPVPTYGFVGPRDYLIALALALTGLRRAEVARIEVDDITATPDGHYLRVRVKGNKHGVVKLVAPLAAALAAWAARWEIATGPLFPRSRTNRRAVGVGTVRNAVKRQAARAGFTTVEAELISPHAFRRTLATLADQRGVSKEQIQRGFLHSNVRTTERYMKLGHAPTAPADALIDLIPAHLR